MSVFYAYICTNSTVDPFIPRQTSNIQFLSQDVSDAFAALAGGHQVVGRLAFFPVQRTVGNHLLCDGREVAQSSFPELYDYLRDSQGTAVDPLNFVLPNYLTTLAPATTAAAETANEGTVYTPSPITPPPGPQPTDVVWGDADSGGRFVRGVIP
jgi:hypothetical protein